ncbi:hypothetical protein C8D90_104205 [Enterobacillus tribolii]|uniref:Uncharacterized protein n=2 Tax=Enterobacillus tribolii TaxID=1487935 RepID=A0A370QS12_9GAMM|nr:hypothetical protein C8D90_104205 [Enterobacillus tribolii]
MIRKYFIGMLLLLFPLISGAARTIIIDMPAGKNGVVEYRVDGRALSFEQLGDTLNKWLLAEPGKVNESHVAVLTNGKAPLAALYNINGLLLQVGFSHPRFFYTSEGTSKLSEIQINYRPLIMKNELQSELTAK